MLKVVISEEGTSVNVGTSVSCDGCGEGYIWTSKRLRHFVGINMVKSILRKEGWKFGKKHLCNQCVSNRKRT